MVRLTVMPGSTTALTILFQLKNSVVFLITSELKGRWLHTQHTDI